MTFASLLLDLQQLLATPRLISDRLHMLSASMSARCPDATDLASLVVRLYDPALDERWIVELWPSTQLLLMTTATSLEAPVTIRRRLVVLLRELRHEFGPSATLHHRPPFVRAPFAAFHWSLWRALARRRAPVYVVVAAFVHARVRALERGMVQDAARFGSRLEWNLYQYLRSARVGCLYAPPLHQLAAALRRDLLYASAHAA